MVKEITVEKVEMAQNYATAMDVGYEDFETDAWCRMLYFPSPTMPRRSLSKYLHWWIFMDLYEAVLDNLTADIENVKIQRCKCGYSFIDFHSHIWQHHPECINPDDGTIRHMPNSIVEVQETITIGQRSDHQ